MIEPTDHPSPSWSSNTKLVIALTTIVVVGALFLKFEFILGPLIIAFVLAYLFYPVASFLHRRLRFSWGAAVGIIYLLLLLFLFSLLTLGGVGLVQQVQSLVTIIEDGINSLPDVIQHFSGQVYHFGPFRFDFRAIDLDSLSRQLLGVVQPLLSRTGTLVSTLAGSAASFLGWTFFVILVSYFVLAESGGLRNQIFKVNVPGYAEDYERLNRELGRIWNAFLRGQVIIFVFTVLIYSLLMALLGVNYAIGIAFLAGLARFVPYAGPAINYLVIIIVTYFQADKPFNLPPLYYAGLVIVLAVLVDQIFDNVITPRILSTALKVHPAAVLVAAIICANLLGLLGVVIAAPILATVTLLWQYTMRKMLDQDPWPDAEPTSPPAPPGSRFLVSLRKFFRPLGFGRKTAK